MSGPATLARPYARAAFDQALADQSLAAWADKLAFAAGVAADREAAALIGNPRVAPEQLVQLFLPPGEAAEGAFARLLGLLASNRRMALLPQIAEGFAELKRTHENVLHVTVRSAAVLDAAATDTLKAALRRRFGKEIELSQTLDPELIGGAVIDAGDVVIDGSVRGRLERMAHSLTL